MLYQPKYCCQCGEKIERAEWKLWTSRRFCELCQTEFVVPEALPKIFAGLMLLIGLIGAGSYWQSAAKPKNETSERFLAGSGKTKNERENQPAAPSSNADPNIQKMPASENRTANLAVNARQSPVLTTQTPNRMADVSAPLPEENVYYCGAQTKKGTPCSRRVKGGGRCWQHKGQPAMLPPEKLIVKQ